MHKKILSIIIILSLSINLFSCNTNLFPMKEPTENYEMIELYNTSSNAIIDYDIENVAIGDEYYNFKLDRIGEVKSFMSKTYTFTHQKSGATLYYMKNDDKKLGFNISYKTIHLDDSDINHIFEHSIISSSNKYKSNDLFFDMMNKSFISNCNASTYNTFTNYFFDTYDEEQLYKDMDIYMSCMVEPSLLTDENIFKREAYRLTLYDKNEDINIQGVVFQEDEGHSTNEYNVLEKSILTNLYPNQYAQNVSGNLVNHWEEASYEKTLDRFHTFYNFDNCIIMLYGDLDIKRAMKFLDNEYLSKYETNKTDLTVFNDEKSIASQSIIDVSVPAFKGAEEKNKTIIAYAIDVSDVNENDLLELEEVAHLLNDKNGVLYEKMKNLGLNNNMSVSLEDYNKKPFFCFYYYDAEPSDKMLFKNTIIDTLYEIKEFGITNMNYESILKNEELNNYLYRNSNSLFVDLVATNVSKYFSLFDKTDYFENSEKLLTEMINDKDQTILKNKTEYLYNCENTTLIAATPKAGLADELREQRNNKLKQIKNELSDEEIENLINETKEFDEWNSLSFSPDVDFSISANELPEIKENVKFNKEIYDGITIYTAPCNVENVSSHNIFFDTSNIKQEDLYYITDLSTLFSILPDYKYSKATWTYIKNIFLNGLHFDFDHFELDAKDNCHPVFSISFSCYDKDYEKSLKYLFDFINNIDFSDITEVYEALKLSQNDYDHSYDNMSNFYDLLNYSLSYKYNNLISGQDYHFNLNDKIEKLSSNQKFANEYISKLEEVKKQIFIKNNLIVSHAGNNNYLSQFIEIDKNILSSLDLVDLNKQTYKYDTAKTKRAYITNTSNVMNKKLISFKDNEQLSGKDLAYWKLLSNEYILPKIRYSGNAYSAGTGFSNNFKVLSVYSYMDKNVKDTYDIYNEMPKFLSEYEIDEKELNMYILSAYSTIYNPFSYLYEGIHAINDDIFGRSNEELIKLSNELKSTTIEDKQHAIDSINNLIENGEEISIGNQSLIEKDKKQFEEIIDLRKH